MPAKKQIKSEEIEIFKKLKASPLFFIKTIWGLTPQKSKEDHFVSGKNITWQQYEFFLAIEKAIKGEDKKRITVRSGHGTGKSASLAMLILWYLFAHKDAQVPCTAPTSDQMYDVLWKEIAKWLKKMPEQIQQLYEWSNSYIRIKESPETWFARAKTARKEAPEALQGIHGDYVMMVIDEASGVDNAIFEAAEGALTNANILVLMIGNPTRLIGYFYDSHFSDKEAWQVLQFNGEESPIVDAQYTQRIIDKYGKDSDEYRMRVLGEFPKADAVDQAGYVPLLLETDMHETPLSPFGMGKLLGIDPAGEGDDETVWVLRDHFKAYVVAREKISTSKTIAQKTLTIMEEYQVNDFDVYVDNFGEGANVAKELALVGKNVNGVNVGDGAEDSERYLNMRAEAYWRVREWLRSGAQLVTDTAWNELLAIRYRSELNGKLRIMGKSDMRRMGIKSPNYADALMLTFVRREVSMVQQYTTSYIRDNGTAFVLDD